MEHKNLKKYLDKPQKVWYNKSTKTKERGDTPKMRKKYYLTLDTETATLGFTNEMNLSEKDKQKIAIMRPIIYDIGWVIADRNGNIVKKVNYLVQETFFVPTVFFTAYYKDKRPFYMAELAQGHISAKCWNEIVEELSADLASVDIATAYNAAFDFKKAIPFTEEYIQALYSADYVAWEKAQKRLCEKVIAGETKKDTNPEYLTPVLLLRDVEYPIADLWDIACDRLINIDKYRNYCLENDLLTASKQYFKTSAETAFQYLMNQWDFVENHTALSDAEIETQILAKALKKGKIEPTLGAFPFRKLGTTYDYVTEKKPKYIARLIDSLEDYKNSITNQWYKNKVQNIIDTLKEADNG